jgi:hypothetical protein
MMIVLEMAQRREKRADRIHVVQYAINTVNEYERRDYKIIKLNAITPKNTGNRETRNERAK